MGLAIVYTKQPLEPIPYRDFLIWPIVHSAGCDYEILNEHGEILERIAGLRSLPAAIKGAKSYLDDEKNRRKLRRRERQPTA